MYILSHLNYVLYNLLKVSERTVVFDAVSNVRALTKFYANIFKCTSAQSRLISSL